MKAGDNVTFRFAKKEKSGVVVRVQNQSAFIKTDFANHKGKVLKRKIAELKA